MAVSIFTRCSHFRHFIGITNNVAILSSNAAQHLISKSRTYTTSADEIDIFGSENKPVKKMNKIMLAYLQRAKEHDEFMKKEITEYEIGKRHLANMMGEDPECFTQEDINRSIEYLFPSGLFDRTARPQMQHPEEIFPSRKVAEFDETGRPHHFMFYTAKPNYNEALYDIVENIQFLNNIEDSLMKQGILPDPKNKIDLVDSTWLSKLEMERLFLESIQDREYDYLITSLERLYDHPLSERQNNFIMKFRKMLIKHTIETLIPPLEYDNTGRPYITVKNCMRKSSKGTVTIWGNGSGKITINGRSIAYFKYFHHREHVSQSIS